jgi:hypothetical protein
MKWVWIFLIIIGIANNAIKADWFAGYLLGVMKFAVQFTPTPNYPDPAPSAPPQKLGPSQPQTVRTTGT